MGSLAGLVRFHFSVFVAPASRYWRAIHSPITLFLLPGPDTGLGLGEGKPDMLGRMRLEPYLLQLMPILRDHYYDHSIPVPRTGQPALSLKYGSRYVTATEPALQLGLLGTGSPGSIESTGSTSVSVSGFVTTKRFRTVDVAGSLGVPIRTPSSFPT